MAWAKPRVTALIRKKPEQLHAKCGSGAERDQKGREMERVEIRKQSMRP